MLDFQFKAGLENDVAYATHMAGRRSSLKALATGTASSINRRSNGMRASEGFDPQGRVSREGSTGGDSSILAMARSRRPTEQEGSFDFVPPRSRRPTEQDGALGFVPPRSRRGTEQDGALNFAPPPRSRRGTEQDGALNFVAPRSRRATEQDNSLDFDNDDSDLPLRRRASFVSNSSKSFLDRSQISNSLNAMLAGLGDEGNMVSRGGSLTSQRSVGMRRVSQMDTDGDVSDGNAGEGRRGKFLSATRTNCTN